MRPAKLAAIIIGGLLILLALGLFVGGGILLWAHGTQRDSAGFFQTATRSVSSSGYALTSPDADLNIGSEVRDWLPRGETAAVRLEAQSTGNEPLFLGIGPSDQVSQYLGDVAHDEIVDFGYPSREIEYRGVGGGAPASPPGEQDFWVAQTEGSGSQSLDWEIEDGNWTAVIMNGNAGSGVDANLSLGARFGLLLPIGIGLLIAGLVFVVIAAVLIFLGLRPSRPALPPHQPAPPGPPPTS